MKYHGLIKKWFPYFILFMGILARIWQFGTVPGGINQDEAYAGYEAYSILHNGIDSAGYAFPVYLTTWGSGMSALNSYLMIPFIAVFGLHTWVIRLPQLIVACFSLWVAWLLMKKIAGANVALFCLFFLAINPWHIFLSRWGLDANLAPGFLLFGLWFFVLGLKKSRYFLLSALMYGLSLYCYATIWPVVPVILMLQLAYVLCYKKIRLSGEHILSAGLLFLLALPLFLFLLVNNGTIPEIRLPFLSIPKLVYMRSGEVSLSNIPENAKNLWDILYGQTDGLPWNSTQKFGIFYHGTLIFFGVGLAGCIIKIIRHFYRREEAPELFLLIWVFGGVMLGLVVNVNINRINCLFIPMILISAMGICDLVKLAAYFMKQREILVLILPLFIYGMVFFEFEQYYFTDYAEEIAWYFCDGLENAMEEAMKHEGTIYVTKNANYARILFYSRQNVKEYIDTVEYTNYPAAFLDVSRFGRFCFGISTGVPDENGIYLMDGYVDGSIFENGEYTMEQYGRYTLAYK